MAWIKALSGKLTNPAIIVNGTTINYTHSNDLIADVDGMKFAYPDQPYIYNIDLTNFNTVTFIFTNTVSAGALYLYIDGVEVGHSSTGSSVTWTFNISSYTGLHTFKFSNSGVGTIKFSNIAMA